MLPQSIGGDLVCAACRRRSRVDPSTRTLYVTNLGVWWRLRRLVGRRHARLYHARHERLRRGCGRPASTAATARWPVAPSVNIVAHTINAADLARSTVSVVDRAHCNALVTTVSSSAARGSGLPPQDISLDPAATRDVTDAWEGSASFRRGLLIVHELKRAATAPMH
jgi:CO/xanthine dehydrogenase Mo-binding subunit